MDKATMDYVTLGIAVVGAVLGVVNLWRAWAADRVRLKLRASLKGDGYGDGIIVTALNLSSFPITVRTVGLSYKGTKQGSYYTEDGESLPMRLEPRTSVSVRFVAPAAEHFPFLDGLWADTECGRRAFDSAPRLRSAMSRIYVGGVPEEVVPPPHHSQIIGTRPGDFSGLVGEQQNSRP